MANQTKQLDTLNRAEMQISSKDTLKVDTVAQTLTFKASRMVDIYYKDKWYRFNPSEDYTINLYSGAGTIYFDTSDNTFKAAGSVMNNSKILVGVNRGSVVELFAPWYYVDDKLKYNYLQDDEIINLLLGNSIGKKTEMGFLQLVPSSSLSVDTINRKVILLKNGQIDIYYQNTFHRLIPSEEEIITLPSGSGYIYFDINEKKIKADSSSNTEGKVLIGWTSSEEIFINTSVYKEDGFTKYNAITDSEICNLVNINGFKQMLHDNQVSVERVHNSIVEYVAGEPVVVFPILTDMHASAPGNAVLNHIDQIVDLDRIFNYDFIANLGDSGLDLPYTETEDTAKDFMRSVKGKHGKFNGPTIFARGNHDDNVCATPGWQVSINEWSTRFSQQRRVPNYSNYESSSVFYIPDKKVKIITLDTSAIGHYSFKEQHLQFMIDNLVITESGWTVILLMHRAPDPISGWVNYPFSSFTNQSAFENILNDFKNKQSGSYQSINWDFTANGNNVIAGLFSGDAHFDADTVNAATGIRYIITQGYGGISQEEIPAWATKWTRSDADTMLIDLVVLKPNQRSFKVFRIGVGNDRLFNY